ATFKRLLEDSMTSLPWHTLLIVGAMLGCFGSRPAPAQPYPTQPIKLIVPASPGGLPDTVARTVGRSLQERLGQPIIVENRAGANGDIGAAALLSLPADGRAFIVWDGGLLSTNPLLHRSLPY